MNRRWLVALWAAGMGWTGGMAAEDGVFSSWTRSAEPMTRTPVSVTVVTRDEIERSGAQTLDEALHGLPSFVFARTGTLGAPASARLRGASTSRDVQILIDDQPLGGVSLPNVDLAQIPVDDIERIEIVRGGGSVLYGAHTQGGVIHVITRRPTEDGATSRVHLEDRSYQTRVFRSELAARKNGAFARVNGGRFRTRGFQDNAEADQIAVTGQAGVDLANGGQLSLSLDRIDHDAELPGGTPVEPGQWNGERERLASTPLDGLKQKTTRARLKAVWPLGVGAVLENTAYASASAVRTDIADAGAATSAAERIRGDDLRLRLPAGLTLGGGYEWDGRRSDATNGVGDPVPASHAANWDLYAQQNWVAGPLTFIPALRFDRHSVFGSFTSPRVTLVVRPTDRWKVSANAGRSFRAPALSELFAPGEGNPHLRPERAWSYDLGLERRIGTASRLAATGFYSRLTDRLAADPTNGDRPVNGSWAERAGGELEAEWSLGALNLRTNYTYQRAVGGTLTESRSRPLRLTPRHLANAELFWRTPRGWTFSNSLRYVHRQFTEDGETGAELPSFALWGARLTKRILAADLFLGLENLTNKRTSEFYGAHGYAPQPGRTYSIGVSIGFRD